jgi:hypothetical protein
MRRFAFLAPFFLAACVVHSRSRMRDYEAPPPPPPPGGEEPAPQAPKADYPLPEDFPAAVRQANDIRSRLATLAEKDRLFETRPASGHLQFLSARLTELLERDAIQKILDQVGNSARTLQDLAERLEGPEGKEGLLAANAQILAVLEPLKKLEPLSDEYELKKLPQGCPTTFKKALVRINGVYNSIHEKIQAGQTQEIPEVARHLKLVAENLKAIGVNDLAYPLKNRTRESADQLRDSVDRLQAAAERDDKNRVLVEIEKIAGAVRILDGVWRDYSGKSALEP